MTRWHNCMHYSAQVSYICTCFLREGNMVVGALAKNDQSFALYSSRWWRLLLLCFFFTFWGFFKKHSEIIMVINDNQRNIVKYIHVLAHSKTKKNG